ncbi:MAG: MaoC family dehydratase N-terminal domain-containing protein [Kiritimatiellia bacterium]|jgi:acyl dehydratase|nr:MaoC family dehydratase N-terminal domain-containing protein [Pseudomonadales bacterium]MDP6469940.1 MaoC family dehydratase N-terminal domain-containing protein [Pseudomonadales bacterium]MDP6828960.1 MaoC family dehydratase N-terminal domain-containing protein [Pseudomonadales bacterium]MDP7024665.1 MaoC family dehydratase N-terminal domain-containing protein [Kiritimatiellia bacterium]|tara:strand:+ start:530 stop:1672 length:1143 start_codon:yes stop_codon:yes gene_type:complete
MTQPSASFPKIEASALASLRKRIGVKIEDTLEPWCHEATRDNIRHYAHGVGDDNPLWCDPEYAAQSRFGTLVAPPSFLFTCDRIISGYVGGLPGIHAMWAGADWTWHKPVLRNDEITTEAWLKDLVEHQTGFAGRSIQQIYHVIFFNQDGDMLAEADSWCFRTERDTAREEGQKYDHLKSRNEQRYTSGQIGEIYRQYEDERPRGASPRYWEDVNVGDELPTMVKGPMTVTGFIAYAQGWGGLYIRANRLAWRQIHKHAGLGIENRYGVPDVPERVHWEQEFAATVGAPGIYDYGPERCSWLIHHLTDWMGDDGFLRHASCKIRRHNPVGDTLFLNGRIVGKSIEDGHRVVEIEHEARNQDNELSVLGSGVIRLPSRESA